MALQSCSGIDVFTGASVAIAFQDTIQSVAPAPAGGDLFVAPAFIDIQVNGYAGVDYNSPHTPHHEIARSLHAQFATGVARLYPTVITGAPNEMCACLSNLAAARDSLPEGPAMDGFHVEGPYISPEDG